MLDLNKEGRITHTKTLFWQKVVDPDYDIKLQTSPSSFALSVSASFAYFLFVTTKAGP